MNSRAVEITNKIGLTTAALVILSAAVLGYTALFDLFASLGLFDTRLGIFFPLLFDLAEVTAAVFVLNAKWQGEDDKFAWRMVITFTALAILANVMHAALAWQNGVINNSQLAASVVITPLFPLSVAWVTHMVKSAIMRDVARRGLLARIADLDAEASRLANDRDNLAGEVDNLTGRRDALASELKELRKDKRQANYTEIGEPTKQAALEVLKREPNITGADLGRELGKSVSTGRKLARELRPQVNGNGAGGAV